MSHGVKEAVEFLVGQKGIDLNLADRYGSTALHCAIRRGEMEIFSILALNSGVDPTIKDLDDISPLYETIMSKMIDMTELLLRRTEVLNTLNETCADDVTPLSLCCGLDDTKYLEMLLNKHQLNPNVAFGNDWTPLLYAIEKDSDSVTILVNSENVDVNMGTEKRGVPIQYAIERQKEKSFMVLVGCSRVDINEKDRNGNTPLINAVRWGQLDIVNSLLKRKDIHVNEQGQNGMTALHAACDEGNIDIVDALLKIQNIDVNMTNSDGVCFSFIERQFTSQSSAIIQILLLGSFL